MDDAWSHYIISRKKQAPVENLLEAKRGKYISVGDFKSWQNLMSVRWIL